VSVVDVEVGVERALRDLPSLAPSQKGKLREIIAVYPRWAGEHVPGHVNGLQLKHAPRHLSWAGDAEYHWGALGELLGQEAPVAPASKAPAKKKDRKLIVAPPRSPTCRSHSQRPAPGGKGRG
jgi:hypothetical protein